MVDEKLSIAATLSSKNQVTLPKLIRNHLGIRSKDKIIFEVQQDGSILVKKQKSDPFWSIVEEEQARYGSFDPEEFDWGEDQGDEVFDDE